MKPYRPLILFVLLGLCSCATTQLPFGPPPVAPAVAPAVTPAAQSFPPPLPPIVQKRAVKDSLTAATVKPAIRVNPYNINLSLIVTNRSQVTFLYSTNPTNWLAGLVLTNTLPPLKWPTNAPRALLPPRVLMRPQAKTLAVNPARPFESIFWTPTDGSANIAYIDSMNLAAGTTYALQFSPDFKTWSTAETITWTDTSPDGYWRLGRVVPSDASFTEVYRLITVP